jgi:hypothetical protein
MICGERRNGKKEGSPTAASSKRHHLHQDRKIPRRQAKRRESDQLLLAVVNGTPPTAAGRIDTPAFIDTMASRTRPKTRKQRLRESTQTREQDVLVTVYRSAEKSPPAHPRFRGPAA